jgi:hypothetical protein
MGPIMRDQSGRSSAIARAARRRRQRGAVMAEGVVVIPFFIIIFAGLVFLGTLYEEKLRTHKTSMDNAWTTALKGCVGQPANALPITKDLPLGAAEGSPQAGLCNTGFGEVNLFEAGAVTRPTTLGGGSQNATTYSYVLCDEDPQTGDFEGAAEFLWQQFAPPEMQVPMNGGGP